MVWSRTFRFPRRTRHFDAVMIYDRERHCIVDWLGRRGNLEVELHPWVSTWVSTWVSSGALHIISGRQSLRLNNLTFPLPRWLLGAARVREWVGADSTLGIEVTIENPILGAFFGYEGKLVATESSEEDDIGTGGLMVPQPTVQVPLGMLLIVSLAICGGVVHALRTSTKRSK